MENETLTIIAAAVLAAVAAAFVAFLLTRRHGRKVLDGALAKADADRERDVQYRERLLEEEKAGNAARLKEAADRHDRSLAELKAENAKALETEKADQARALETLKADYEKNIRDLKESYEKSVAELRDENSRALQQQISAVKSQITAESEKVLKSRQEEFSKHAEESFSTIAGDFNKNLKDMKEAFEANKKSQNDTSAELKTHIEAAVSHLKDQTRDIGEKADRLASALRGGNKMQGCWGETQLANILQNEGLVEGRDYDREETLRDDLGLVIHNDDTGKRMRPDFILHYPDRTDIVVDCKVSLNALSDYVAATTDEERKSAAERNLKAIKDQVEDLARKSYTNYLKPGHKCLDYVLMFVPNVNALALARQSDPHIIADAFAKNVLITSEETFMPFLRLVRSAWVNFEQARNQEKLVAAAQKMIDRVADFCGHYAEVGKKLDEARASFDKGSAKIADKGQSILKAAHEVVSLGVRNSAKKNLPPLEDPVLFIDSPDE